MIEVIVKCENQWINVSSKENVLEIKNFCDKNDGKEIILILKKPHSKRSVKANRFYWGVVVTAFQRFMPDMSKEEVHRILGDQLRKYRRSEDEIQTLKEIKEKHGVAWIGSDEWYIKNSSDMDTMEFYIYCEQCITLLFDMGGSLDEKEGTELLDLRKEFEHDTETKNHFE